MGVYRVKWLKPTIIEDRRLWIMYLTSPIEGLRKGWLKLVEIPPNEEFYSVVSTHVKAYMKGEAPPDSIASAILNIADDIASGRDVIIRAGDYISIQNFMRSQ
jgi:hypothetical protein